MTPYESPPLTTSKRTTILLVDDHPLVRRGLAQLINAQADLLVCGEAGTPDEALAAAATLRPGMAIVDLGLGNADGLDLVKALAARHPQLPVLVCSMHQEATHAERALRAGAKGYVMKEESDGTVLAAIRRVLSGQIHVSEQVASRMLLKLVNPGAAHAAPTVDRLSDREYEVFGLIGRGVGPSEIARRLGVSVKTVETHREHIKQKLKLPNGRELLRAAMRHAESNPGGTGEAAGAAHRPASGEHRPGAGA
jgi:DNA-binding NarL/FixJ family response regulator